MADSLVISNAIELLGGGVVSVNPACAGAVFRLQPGFDLGAPQPTTDFVASLILDGERPLGRRASNRLIKLPIWITAPDRRTLAAAREVLEQTIDQDTWTLTWVRDPGPGGTPLPLIIDCFRAQPTVPTYNTLFEKEISGLQVTVTIPALPYGRSDVQQQIAFAAPVPQTPPPPPPPVVIDTFSTISSAQHFQSSQCVVGPRSCGWDPDAFGDYGGQNTAFIYTASLATTLNLTGMTSLAMWLGFGSRYYTSLEYHGKIHGVSVYLTLTDTSGNTLGFSRPGMRLPVSPVAQQPVFSRVSMPIPQNSATFNYASVAGYTLEIINRQDRIRRLSWVVAYVDALTAYPPSQTANPVTRGALYTLYGLQGTARAAATLAFQQPPTAGSPSTFSSAGISTYTVPAGAAWLKVEAVGGGGAGSSLTTTGNGGGGGGGAYAAEYLFPAVPGQVIPYNVGAGGTAGATPVNGQPTIFGPGPSGPLVVTANGGSSAAQNSATGAAGGLTAGNAVSFSGGTGRTATGSVGGGGGSSGGSSSAGLMPTGTAATVFTSPTTANWTCPPGVTQVYAECWGSGGSGGVGASGNGAGGGGGEYAAQFVAVTPGNSYSYTVPAGGAASSVAGGAGNAGASATFTGDASVTVTAHGGGGGQSGYRSSDGGSAGSGSSASVHFTGGKGGTDIPYSGSGGSSAGPASAGNAGNGYGNLTPAPSGGGAGGAGTGANAGLNGTAGSAPGGGGGGTYGSTTSGAGAAGQVRLTYPGGLGAPTSNGAAAVTGGGAGGAGGPSANTAGSAGSAPGGAGGGGCSTGTAEAGGVGAAGNLKITPYSSAAFKSLIVHRPPLGALKTFVPLVPVGAGADAPDGTHQYSVPQPVTGINADFGGTYTIYLIASSLNGSSNRTITVTVTQYEYAGGPSSTTSTLPVTLTPAQVTNGIITAGVLTLPAKAVAADNAGGYYSLSVTDTNTADRFYDAIFLDTMGQTVVISEAGSGYINYYLDAPEPNLDLGLIMGSSGGRPDAISVYDACQAISGGAMAIEPADGENQLFAYSADAMAPNISVSYYAAWFFDRTQQPAMVAVVQHKSFTGASVSSLSGTVTAVGAGNTLIVAVSTPVTSASVTSVKTGGVADNWASAYTPVNPDGFPMVWWDPDCTGGTTTLAITLSASDSPAVDFFEVSGLGAAPAVDRTVDHATTGAGPTWTSDATGTTTAAVEFVLGAMGGYNNTGTSPTLTGPSSPWTNETALAPGTALYQISGYQITSSTGTFTYSGTSNMTSPNTYCSATVVTFKGVTVLTGTAALSGTGTLTGAGVFAGAAALSGIGTLTGTGTATGFGGGAALSGTGTLTGAATGIFVQAAGLSGTGTLTATWIGTLVQPPAGLDGEGTLGLSGVILKYPAALAGVGTLNVLQATGGLVFASPGAAVPYAYPLSSQVMVAPPGTTAWRPLGSIGRVTALTYSFTCPGGADTMSCTVMVPAAYRTQLFNPGWQVRITRGGHQVWDGKMDEPVPTSSGWNLTAVGTGNFGQDFEAVYSMSWPNGAPDEAINNAISRGMPWVNPGVGQPSGAWFGQATDSGAQTITALLGVICTRGGLTWTVNSQPGGLPGDDLSVFPLPTVPNRMLVATTPVARTLGGDINTIWIRYQSAAASTGSSGSGAAVYGLTSVTNQASVTLHGPLETYIDLSNAGTLSSGAAQAVGNQVLAVYQRASYAGPFTAARGQLLTTGGQPIDPGTDQAGTMIRLILTDFGYGGEVTPGPAQFIVGSYSWDDLAQVATIVPYQSVDQSLTGLLSLENTVLAPVAVPSGTTGG